MRNPLYRLLVICLIVAPLVHQARAASRMVGVIVELNDTPAVVVFATGRPHGVRAAQTAARKTLSAIGREQDRITTELSNLDGIVLARMQRAYNGLIVLIPERRIAAVRALRGVRSVHFAVRHSPSNARSVPSIGAPQAWTYVNGLTGRAQRIAIVDTGIDYTHADFGGLGTPAAFDAARANTAILEPGSGFPSVKMPNGIDLVGDQYNADNATTSIPVVDSDPLDCYGHGTHVAGTAAGYGVEQDGATYRGSYDAQTPFDTMRIGPGVAPEAALYAVKIFGCSGSTILTPAAIEWAIDPDGDGDFSDRMDVINLSLGAPFGSGYDVTTVAADNAALAGIVVVASAGNDGDTTFASSTPGTADRTIAVAAASGTTLASFSSRGPRRGDAALKPDITAPGVGINSAGRGRGSYGTYLSGTSMAAPHVAGAAALLRQAHPTWTVEQIKAALINTTTMPFNMNGATYSPTRSGAGQVDVGRVVRTSVVAFGADEQGRVALSFGSLQIVDRYAVIKNLRVVNESPATQVFNVRATATKIATGATVRPLIERITLFTGGSATIPVLLDVPDASLLVPAADATRARTALNQSRHHLGEVAGSIELTPVATDAEVLVVPYYGTLRRAATMKATAARNAEATNGEIALQFAGTSSLTTTLASVYELQLRSPKLLPTPTEESGVLMLGEAADLQYVGVTVDNTQGGRASSRVSFGLATYAPWSTPSETTVVIQIDADRDGIFDYSLRTYDGGPAGVGSVGDVFLVERTDLRSGVTLQIGRVNYTATPESGLFNGRVMGFGVRAADIGLSDTRTRFDYRVTTYHRDVTDDAGVPVVVDVTPILSYDIARPGFATSADPVLVDGTPLHFIADGTIVSVAYDAENVQRNRSSGLIILHHTNNVAAQAQEISIALPVATAPRIYLPLVRH